MRNLLEASGEGDKLGFAFELPNFAGGPAIYEAIRADALDIAYVGDTPPIQARAAGTLLPINLALWAVGVAGLGAGGYLFFTAPSGASAQVSASASGSQGTLWINGRF